MTSQQQRRRQPGGTPTGGRFAPETHAEGDVVLETSETVDPWAAAASQATIGETDQFGNRWSLCEECGNLVGAERGSNEWSEADGQTGCAGTPGASGVHRPDSRVPITDLRLAEEKVLTLRSEIATMASSDIDDRRVGSVGLHGAVQRLAAAEVEAELWDRVQTRLDANPAEFPTVDAAIASVYDQVLDEIIDSGANDTASGRAGDIRRVRFDAERTWLSRRRLQGQVPTRS